MSVEFWILISNFVESNLGVVKAWPSSCVEREMAKETTSDCGMDYRWLRNIEQTSASRYFGIFHWRSAERGEGLTCVREARATYQIPECRGESHEIKLFHRGKMEAHVQESSGWFLAMSAVAIYRIDIPCCRRMAW